MPTYTEYRLPHSPSTPAEARALAAEAVRDQLPEPQIDKFVLMVSELVTNAVRHAPPEADGRIALRIEIDGPVARAIVMDGGHHFSFDQATFDGTRGHLGLHIVDQLASKWGLSLDGEKAVWFEIEA